MRKRKDGTITINLQDQVCLNLESKIYSHRSRDAARLQTPLMTLSLGISTQPQLLRKSVAALSFDSDIYECLPSITHQAGCRRT